MQLIIQGLLVGLSLGSVYVLMALGLTLMFGILGIVNLAHGVLYMLGAYLVYLLCNLVGFNFFFSFFLSIITIGLFGLLLERFLYRSVGGQFAPVIVMTVGLGITLESASYLAFGTMAKGIHNPITGSITILGLPISNYRIFIILCTLLLILSLYYLIHRTAVGRSMRAVEEDKIAASLQGINVNRINAFVFFLGAALAAAAGAFVAPLYSIEPTMGTLPMTKAFIVIVIGGMGSIPGAIISGFLIGIIDSVLSLTIGTELTYITVWLLVIIFLNVRPRGLFGAY